MVTVDYGKLIEWSPEQVALIKDTVAKGVGLSNAELALFGYVAAQYGLDPLRRQMYAVRYDKDQPVTFQVAIDGFRALAKRSGKMRGYTQTQWCGQDGIWVDVWTRLDVPPWAARVGVRHVDYPEPVFGTALYTEYVATRRAYDNEIRDGSPPRVPNSQWSTRPAHMLAKCAEALAIRTAFPEDVGGLVTDDEMENRARVTIDGTSTEVLPEGDRAPGDERFGATKATFDDMIAGAREALQPYGGNLGLIGRLPDFPEGVQSIKEGLPVWARMRPEEDVVEALKRNLLAMLAPETPEIIDAPIDAPPPDPAGQPSLMQ